MGGKIFKSNFRIGTLVSRRWVWVTLGGLTLVVRLLGWLFGDPVGEIYYTTLFPVARWVQDFTLGLSPVPLAYALMAGILIWVGYRLWRWRTIRWKGTLRRLVSLAGALLFFFHVFWGFNYMRHPLAHRFAAAKPELDAEELCQEAEWAARHAEAARAAIPGATADSLEWRYLPDGMEAKVREAVVGLLGQLDFSAPGRTRGRILYPKGILLRMGIAGVFNPFTGEGQVDAGVIPPLIPSIMAHEMAHGYGFTDEGSCNFVGMAACMGSPDPVLSYSGYLNYWQYASTELYAADPLMYRMLRASLDAGMGADLRANYNNHLKYAGWLAKVGEEVNNTYLKTQGIRGGIKSYSRVVRYIAHWRINRAQPPSAQTGPAHR